MSVRVSWLGHSTVVLDLDGVRLLTDPLLRPHAGLLRRRGGAPAAESWSGADAILLSHLHYDHADLRSLRLLPDIPVITAPSNAEWLVRNGINGVGVELDTWVPVGGVPGVEVALTYAVHHSRPMPHRPNAANGHLVRSSSGIVWAAGDTALFAAMDQLAETAGGPIDVALVPVSGWGPRLSAGHLGPKDAAVACRRIGARVAIPVHWGTLHVPAGRHLPPRWMDAAGPAFAAALEQEAPSCRPIVLEVGGSVTLPSEDAG